MSKQANFEMAVAEPSSPQLVQVCVAARRADVKSIPAKILQLLCNAHALAVFDQLLVSGTSFIAAVLIGRFAGSAELGVYSIAISLLASMLALQNALVLLPYSIQQHWPGSSEAVHAGGSLTLSGVLSAAAAAVMLIAAVGLIVGGAQPALVSMCWALAPVLPFALMREFARRFAFARLRMRTALVIDVTVAAIQLAMLGYLASTGAMTAVMACAALGLACACPALVWLIIARAGFSIELQEVRKTATRSWELGKWLILGQLTVQVQSYVAFWLSMVIAGAAVTGVYAACMSIVAFANPLIFGIGNILTPKLALAWKQGGSARLRIEALRNALLLGGIMAVFCAVLAFAGEDLMLLLFHGSEYSGYGAAVTVLAFAMLATVVGMPASNALASMERPRAIVIVGGVGAAVTVMLISLLMLKWGLLGAAYGVLAGSVVGAVGRWVAFLLIARDAQQPAPISDALLRSLGVSADRVVTRLGEGDHAAVYAVAASDDDLQDAVVIKLYRPDSNPDMAQAQFDGLERLHAALHGRVFDGWTMHVPRPLALSRSPLTLTMAGIPGQSLDAYAAEDRTGPEVLRTAAGAFAAAMQDVWAQGLIHGDLGLRNVMFDLEAKTLALIDPGTPESCCTCNKETHACCAAALDLGHLLVELGTDVNDLTGDPAVRAGKQAFVAGVLRSVLVAAGSRANQERLLEEIRRSIAAHLASILMPSVSARGLWHLLVKTVAERRIADMLALLDDELISAAAELPRSRAA